MITGFIWKGVVRDKRRSLLPFIVVAIGVMVVVFMDGFMGGVLNDMLNMTARYEAGHLKVITRAYHDNADQKPNDMALLETDELISRLEQEYPDVEWCPRIFFGGLLDIPDENGETKAQGPVSGTAYDLLSPGSGEADRMNLEAALVTGKLIANPMEVLVSVDFAEQFGVTPGDTLTFFGSTMYGSMSFANMVVAGVLKFGLGMLDRGAIIVDISDARLFLDMDDAAGELFGFLPNDEYDFEKAEAVKASFNTVYENSNDEFAPVMIQLTDQNGMGEMVVYVEIVAWIMVVVLILALSIVLWNTGILSGIRRYNEYGIRLAMGERKGHLFKTVLTESLLIGMLGSIAGTILGIAICWYLKNYGISYGSYIDNLTMMMDPVMRADITPRMFFIGFIPGVISMLIGTALSGTAIYKRETARLFKELE